MAYIPKEDEEQASGMNVLGPQSNQQSNSEAQNQGSSGPSAESSTIGQGAGSQAPTGPNTQSNTAKKAKSGMFTNIRKYINQNRGGGQRMSQAINKNVSNEANNIRQAIGKQETDFMSRVNQNRQRMQDARGFGEETVNTAQQQQNQEYMQQQQQDLQGRVDAFAPNVVDQSQNINQYQTDIANQQQAINDLQSRYGQYTFGDQFYTDLGDVQNIAETNRWAQKQRYEPAYLTQQQLQTGIQQNDPTVINYALQDIDKERQQVIDQMDAITQANQGIMGNTISGLPDNESLNEYVRLQDLLGRYDQYKSDLTARQDLNQQIGSDQQRLENLQNELSQSQELQRLYNNKQQIQDELTSLEEKIQNAPEALTEQDIQRFNNLRTGAERFDEAILNLSEQSRRSQDLTDLAKGSRTSEGRRELLRQTYGRQGQYTAGQSALDNLIFAGDTEARRGLIQGLNQQAQEVSNQLKDAERQGLITRDEMVRANAQLQKDLQTQLDTAQAGLQSDLEQRLQSGEGIYSKELMDRLASGQGLTEQDMAILGLTGQERFNVDPQSLRLQYDPTQYSIQDVANLTDVSRAQALARLSGKQQQDMFLNEDEIRRRNLRGEGDQFTTSFGELSEPERNSLMEFKGKLMDNLQFGNLEQARDDVRSDIASMHNGNELEPVASHIQQMVETGSGRMDDILNPTDRVDPVTGEYKTANQVREEALGEVQHLNYWAWAGRGRHGVATPTGVLYNAIKDAYNKTRMINDAYSGKGQLQQENVTNFSTDPRYYKAK